MMDEANAILIIISLAGLGLIYGLLNVFMVYNHNLGDQCRSKRD